MDKKTAGGAEEAKEGAAPAMTAEVLTTEVLAADRAGVARAVALLAAGGIAAIPTETVYGLAADAAQGDAVARIYAAKGRPSFNPLITHVVDRAMAARYAHFLPMAAALADRFWPGPLTLVLPRAADAPVATIVTAGLPTIALRAPQHPVMRAVIDGLGRGVAAPSANRSGRISPTRADHVLQSMAGRIPLVLDSGDSARGIESTIVAIDDEKATLLREGAIAREEIAAFIGAPLASPQTGAVRAPGMTLHHYAPLIPLRMEASGARDGEFLIGFGAVPGDCNLSPAASLVEAAANLFAALYAAEASGCRGIAVAPIPPHGLGAAINDRLRRAASSAGKG